MRVKINSDENFPLDVSEVSNLLSSVELSDDLEIWISLDDGQSLCALINKNCGWLMYLRFHGDVGFSSRNFERSGQGGVMELFTLANGQLDSYPRSWTFDRVAVFATALEFVLTSNKPTSVAWHADGAS